MSRRKNIRNQMTLIPELVKERIEKKPHEARFCYYIANALYLPFYEIKEKGAPAYDRVTIVALILYGFFRGQLSSLKIIETAKYDLGAIWILGSMKIPSAKTIERVIDEMLEHVEIFFKQIIDMCLRFNLIGQETMYIDGTKTKANASKHKAMSYEHMNKKIDKGQEQISDLMKEIINLIPNCENLNDEELEHVIITEAKEIYKTAKAEHEAQLRINEEALFKGEQTEKLNKNNNTYQNLIILNKIESDKQEKAIEKLDAIGFKSIRLENIQEAKCKLEESWKKENGNKAIPKDTQINFTDSDSAIMVTKHHGVQQCYNNFALVDEKAYIIVGAYTTNISNDFQALIPTIEHANETLGLKESVIIGADAGFFSADNIKYTSENNIDYYVSYPQSKSNYAKDKFKYDEINNCYYCPNNQTLEPGRKISKDTKTTVYKTNNCLECSDQKECTKAKDGIRKIIRDNENDKIREDSKLKAQTPEGREILRMRKSVPEPVWGNMRERDGLIQLHYRGLDKAGKEFKLRCIMHNLRKLFKVFANNPKARNEIIEMGSKPLYNAV